ncbi:MAG: hypothetical protein KGR26_16845, partial [Cyanobacteria bacterium REEB65]|nr:hypothetical protein [Cyanobacteria bacterium REEB65]
ISTPVVMLRRAAADTGGTAATGTANPANTVSEMDSNLNPSPTATLISYTANPTINDASPTYLGVEVIPLPTASTAAVNNVIKWHFESMEFDQQPTLRGTAQQLCLNLNGASVSSGSLNININWSEQ